MVAWQGFIVAPDVAFLPVLDTEFLFAMRHSDSKHHFIKSILDDLERIAPDKKKELVIPPLAIFELVIVCMSE